MNVLAHNSRFVYCDVLDKQTNIKFFCAFVYAYPKKNLQHQLWNNIINLRPTNNEINLWLLLDDFNNIINLNEKVGGNRRVPSHMIDFNKFLSEGSLISIPTSGVPFTWSNGHKDNTNIYERLERAITNSDWLNLYPNTSLHNYPIFGSDHSAILLDTNTLFNANVVGSNKFKFEAIWFTHPNFVNVISKAWSDDMPSNSCDKVRSYLGRFKFLIKKWNKDIFRNIFYKKKVLMSE